MILYFSGTGNSTFIARKLAHYLSDDLLNINERIKEGDLSPIFSQRALIFSCPTHGYRLPRMVEEWIRKTSFTGTKKAYFILTCGSSVGNAQRYVDSLCKDMGWEFMGLGPIIMPENYIALFKAPGKDAAREIIYKAVDQMTLIGREIQEGHRLSPIQNTPLRSFLSSVINPLFYRFIVKDKAFYSTEKCIGCGNCERLCPLNNIALGDKRRPHWLGHCCHCMACINHCPSQAIEY